MMLVALIKSLELKGAEKFCTLAGRQRVAWACPVIADGNGRVIADENRAGIGDFFGDGAALVAALNLQMFGGKIVGKSDDFFHIFCDRQSY